MKKVCVLLGIGLVIGASIFAYTSTDEVRARCLGAKSCRACKNCKYCAHCAKNRGTCGVCN